MSSPSPIVRPDRPVASRNAISAARLTIVEADDSMSRGESENNRKVPGSCSPETAEDHPTFTERVLTFLDERSA